MGNTITPVYYGTKAKLVLNKLLAPVDDLPRWQIKFEKDRCSGYYYEYLSNQWIAFDNTNNELIILELNTKEEAEFSCTYKIV